MIGRSHRFHGYNSLRSVYRQGTTIRGNAITLKYAARTSGKPYRVAVVVSKKTHKSAVVRNRIRRRIYEACRLQADQLTGLDLVFTVFSDQVATIEPVKLQSMVAELLQKATDKHRSTVL